MSKYINPLENDTEEQENLTKNMESTSNVLNHEGPSVCPKCKKNMGTARLASNEVVYYCTKCRVSSPLAK